MKQLDPKAVWFFFLQGFLRWIWLFFFVLLATFDSPSAEYVVEDIGDDFPAGVWWIITMLYLVFLIIWSKLSYRFYKYEVTDIGFRKERGIVYKKYVIIPYDRIQNIDIYRGILARILGLSDLKIQTAGMSGGAGIYSLFGGASEGRLPGLSREVAEQLRDELIARATKAKKNQGV